MDPITKPRSKSSKRLSGVIKPPKILNPNLYKASKALEAGETFYYKKEYESAKKDLVKGFSSLKADENVSEQLFLNATRIYGEIMVLEENYLDALDFFNKALKSSPSDSTTLQARGLVNIKLQRYLDALNDFNTFLNIEPTNPDALSSRGSLFKKLGRYDEALEDYTKAMKISNRKDLQLLLNRGKVYLAQTRYEEALNDFNELLNLRNQAESHIKVWIKEFVDDNEKLRNYEFERRTIVGTCGRKYTIDAVWEKTPSIEANNNVLDGSTSINELQSIQPLSSCSPKSPNHLFTPKIHQIAF
ncbi:689_t:CDS:2 [Dentiscutata heterogama]|uniref:689_t:CDS:1 n=1 Tax=Dentiscutata heterogama TaxID=1316150 RepID=A0ACA9KHX4_9GLOM|nr:689_t:CDS:2 [Dentiscutata heterogama]